ncbi:hypothetical protein MTO96_047221 [Rhipicephalus appendiculatus]
MPDRGGLRTLHQPCEWVSGANWRPTRFQDDSTVYKYACRVCHVIPRMTVRLPCSHILCEQCMTGCVVQDGGRVCPVDAKPFREDEYKRQQFPLKMKQSLKVSVTHQQPLSKHRRKVFS